MKFQVEQDGQLSSIGVRPTTYHSDEANPNLASNMLGWFTPSSDIEIKRESLSEYELCSMQSVFMENLIARGSGRDNAIGFVTKVDCFAEFVMPEGGSLRLIDGLLRVKNTSDEMSLPLTEVLEHLLRPLMDIWLAFIVGLLDDGALVAPLKEFCEIESFTVATNEQIAMHNSRIGTEPTSEPSYADLPEPIIKILGAIAPAAEPETPVRQIVSHWLHDGWNDVVADQRESAFAPYSEYFGDVNHDLYTLDEAFTLFVKTELSWELGESDAIFDHLADGYLDFIGIVNAEYDVETDLSSSEPVGSHDRVIRAVEEKHAA